MEQTMSETRDVLPAEAADAIVRANHAIKRALATMPFPEEVQSPVGLGMTIANLEATKEMLFNTLNFAVYHGRSANARTALGAWSAPHPADLLANPDTTDDEIRASVATLDREITSEQEFDAERVVV